jgi:hypothetical protein
MFMAGVRASEEPVAEPTPEAKERSLTEKLAEALWRITGRYERHQAEMEARRYQDGTGDPDYGRRLRELEGQIAEIDREQGSFRMGDYHENGGGRFDKWAIPGLVTLAVSGIIGNVVQSMTVSALRQEVTDLKAQVERIDRLVEPRFRGG